MKYADFRAKDQASRNEICALLHISRRPALPGYRGRPTFAALVKASLISCGGAVAEQDRQQLDLIDGGRP